MLAAFARRARALAIAAIVVAAAPSVSAQEQPVLVFAAASLKTALDEINAAWQRASARRVTVSYAASSALAKQIESGAPADVFISADIDWMDHVEKAKLVRADTRVSWLKNRIVLIAPSAGTATITLAPGLDLKAALGDGRLAMANTNAVPAGKYGKSALLALGAWDGVKDRVAQAENVRAALLLVARGEAPFGIVYATDAASEPKVKTVGMFPESTHPPIVYPLAVLARSKHAAAAPYAVYLRGAAAKAILEKHGFAVIGGPTN